jgi:hypothetical protein
MFSLQQNWRTRGWSKFYLEVAGGNNVYTLSKCKNDFKNFSLKKKLNLENLCETESRMVIARD